MPCSRSDLCDAENQTNGPRLCASHRRFSLAEIGTLPTQDVRWSRPRRGETISYRADTTDTRSVWRVLFTTQLRPVHCPVCQKQTICSDAQGGSLTAPTPGQGQIGPRQQTRKRCCSTKEIQPFEKACCDPRKLNNNKKGFMLFLKWPNRNKSVHRQDRLEIQQTEH